MFSEGYIGITTSLERRFSQHKYASKSGRSRINKIIRKYSDELIYETILIGTKDYCLEVEKKLRPDTGIGYNHATGGAWTGKEGCNNSEDTRAKLSASVKAAYERDPTYRVRNSESKKGKKMSETQKENHLKAMNTIKYFPWTNSQARNDIWIKADEYYEYYKCDNTISLVEMCKYFELKYHNLKNMFNRFNSGWVPLEDLDWKEYFNK